MTKRSESKKADAVSPVVGVMLMLVVTIIIAAVVSAFAGGLADSEEKPSQLLLEATYSQADGFTITHAGGDPVSLVNVDFLTTPSDLFGADADKFRWVIHKSIINNSAGDPIYKSISGYYLTPGFVAGDTLSIDTEHSRDWIDNSSGTTPYDWTEHGVNENARVMWSGLDKDKYFGAYAFSYPANIGKYFYLDVVDPTGSVLARTRVTITG